MDAKLRSILALALRPETGDGEAAAALAAARRMVAKSSFDSLVGAASTPEKERVVYRDRVVYRSRSRGGYSTDVTITVSPSYQHSMIERVFQDAERYGVDIHVNSCGTVDNKIHNSMILNITITGDEDSVTDYANLLKGYIDDIKRKRGSTSQSTASSAESSPAKSHSFWDRLKDLI